MSLQIELNDVTPRLEPLRDPRDRSVRCPSRHALNFTDRRGPTWRAAE
jgi:hypothetical protein